MAAFAPTSTTQGVWQIEQIYIGYYGRAADAAGYDYWQTEFNARTNGTYKIANVVQPKQSAADAIASIASSFGASGQSETIALYPFLAGTVSLPSTDNVVKAQITSFVNSVYQNLFNRAPDAAGQTYWVNQIATGAFSTSVAILTIANAAGADGSTQSLADAKVLNNKIAVSDNFLYTTALANVGTTGNVPAAVIAQAKAVLIGVDDTAASVTAANTAQTAWIAGGAGAVAPSTTFGLTTGADNIPGTAGNDIINGYINTTAQSTDTTLTAADVISGGAGTDVLKITVSGTAAGSLPAAAITGVENFYIRDVNSSGASTYDFSGLTGVQQVWSDRSTQAVTFDKLAAGVTVGLAGNGSTVLGAVTGNYVASVTTGSLAIDGGVGPAGTVAPAVTLSGAGILSQTISSSGAANKIGALGLAATTTSATINASTALTTGAVTANALQKLTVTGAGAVDITAGALATTVTTIDASGSTGGLSVKVGASGLTSFTGGSGNDTLIGSAAASALGAYDGGTGTDTVSALSLNLGNAAQFKNFEQIDLAGFVAVQGDTLDLSFLTASTISGAVISGAVGGANTAILSNANETAAGFNVIVTDTSGTSTGTTKLSFASASVAGSSDIVNVTFKAVDQAAATTSAAGILSISKIESLNIDSKGGANISNQIKVTDDDLKSITITGNKDLTLEVTGQSTSVASTTATQLTSIDGSAATGKLNITLNTANAAVSQSAITIKGGSADDTFVLVTSSAGSNTGASTSFAAPTVAGGAGNDTFNIAGALAKSATAPGIVTITDFSKGDILLGSAGTLTAFASAKIDVSASSTFVDALNIAELATNTAKKASWFQLAGNTYVVVDVATAGTFDTGDLVVKLTGLLDLSTSTYAANAITFA